MKPNLSKETVSSSTSSSVSINAPSSVLSKKDDDVIQAKYLTSKQKNFADKYFSLGLKSPLKAALASGYKQATALKSGAALLENRHVRAYLDALQKQEKKNAILSRSEALKLLAAIARGETQEEVYINEYDPQTRKMVTVKRTKSASAKDRINALEVMLKFSEFEDSGEPMTGNVASTDEKLLKALSKRNIQINVSGEVSFEEDAPDASAAKE